VGVGIGVFGRSADLGHWWMFVFALSLGGAVLIAAALYVSVRFVERRRFSHLPCPECGAHDWCDAI